MTNINILERKGQKLSIIIPVYNEPLTIEEIIKKVIGVNPLPWTHCILK